jgi:thiol-disulfide isomerase/thioredoxin
MSYAEQTAARCGGNRQRLLLACLLGCVAAAGAWAPAQAGALQAGDAWPPIAAADVEGALPTLKGQVVLIDFWASWCGPCKQSFPELETLYTAFRGRGLVVLAVNEDEELSAMKRFLEQHPVSFRVVRDRGHTLIQRAGAEAMPTSLIIDRGGRVVAVHSGFHGSKTVADLTAEIVKALGPAAAATP